MCIIQFDFITKYDSICIYVLNKIFMFNFKKKVEVKKVKENIQWIHNLSKEMINFSKQIIDFFYPVHKF